MKAWGLEASGGIEMHLEGKYLNTDLGLRGVGDDRRQGSYAGRRALGVLPAILRSLRSILGVSWGQTAVLCRDGHDQVDISESLCSILAAMWKTGY